MDDRISTAYNTVCIELCNKMNPLYFIIQVICFSSVKPFKCSSVSNFEPFLLYLIILYVTEISLTVYLNRICSIMLTCDLYFFVQLEGCIILKLLKI